MRGSQKDDDSLNTLLHARDFRAIEKFLATGTPLTNDVAEDIARALMEIQFGRLTLTAGYWPLAKRLLSISVALRQHVFAVLSASAVAMDPYQKTDRSNLLHAIRPLRLTADELGVLRGLRDQISPPVYREDVDAVLYEHATDEDRMDALEQIWIKAHAAATGKPVSISTADVVAKTLPLAPEETRWHRDPFRLLVCMPFQSPTASRAWTARFRPAFDAIGDVLRLDWSTDDWVRDFRRLTEDASFVLVDLTTANANVRRELGYISRKDIPCVCYAHGERRASTVGQIHPVLSMGAGGIDMEVWGMHVYSADYESTADLDRLVSIVVAKISPFQDQEDPTAPYVGRNLGLLPAVERRGLEIARIPRSRTSAERLLKEGKELISESAIFGARVFAWLGDPHLHLKCPENLWLREHLLMVVHEGVRRGHRLTAVECSALEACIHREAVESLRDLEEEVAACARRASTPSPAERRGLPQVPPEAPLHPGPPRASIRIELTAAGEPAGLHASDWPETFGVGAVVMRRAMFGEFGPLSNQRLFALEFTGSKNQAFSSNIGEIEDALDALAPALGALTPDMARTGWSHLDIETFLQATISLAILRELRRRQVFEIGRGEQEHERLAHELAYIWGRPTSELRLFEFAAKSRPIHFRGLFPWGDVKEQATRVYAGEAAKMLGPDGISEEETFEQAMDWEYPPAQLWDALIRPRMPEVASPTAMRSLWSRYVVPSASLYWRVDLIYTDPADTKLWAYA
jgi:hypothetical protein